MTPPRSFRLERNGPVVRMTLDRPEQMNALTFLVYRELTATFRELTQRDTPRAVVLTGAGRAFCTGGDVREIIGPLLGRPPDQLLEFTQLTCDLVRAMRALPCPIVASINGTAAGAGAILAIASDLRVAADTALIAFLFVKVGLAGADMGAAQLLPRIVGLGRATELLMTGDFVTADEAYRIGLYNRVVPATGLTAATDALVDRLVRGPAEGLAATKAALEAEATMSLDAALDDEARIQARLMARPDFREGFTAFSEKRPPRFAGAPE